MNSIDDWVRYLTLTAASRALGTLPSPPIACGERRRATHRELERILGRENPVLFRTALAEEDGRVQVIVLTVFSSRFVRLAPRDSCDERERNRFGTMCEHEIANVGVESGGIGGSHTLPRESAAPME